MVDKKYNNNKINQEFINIQLKETQKDEIFLSLDENIQNEILESIKNLDNKYEKKYSISQILVYGSFLVLVFSLIINVFINIINIPINIYLIFFALTLGTMILIYSEQKRSILKRVNIILNNWEDMPYDTINDFVLVIKNEIECTSNSPL